MFFIRHSHVADGAEVILLPQAPEAFKRGKITHRSDIYSLGVILNETLTHTKPWPAEYTPYQVSLILFASPQAVLNWVHHHLPSDRQGCRGLPAASAAVSLLLPLPQPLPLPLFITYFLGASGHIIQSKQPFHQQRLFASLIAGDVCCVHRGKAAGDAAELLRGGSEAH